MNRRSPKQVSQVLNSFHLPIKINIGMSLHTFVALCSSTIVICQSPNSCVKKNIGKGQPHTIRGLMCIFVKPLRPGRMLKFSCSSVLSFGFSIENTSSVCSFNINCTINLNGQFINGILFLLYKLLLSF